MKVADHVAHVLSGDTTIGGDNRRELWDLARQSNSVHELDQHLNDYQSGTLHPRLVRNLLVAKSKELADAAPVKTPMDKVVDAITKMGEMDRSTLDLAESHPHVFQAHMQQALSEKK
jgi:hypothetical protein